MYSTRFLLASTAAADLPRTNNLRLFCHRGNVTMPYACTCQKYSNIAVPTYPSHPWPCWPCRLKHLEMELNRRFNANAMAQLWMLHPRTKYNMLEVNSEKTSGLLASADVDQQDILASCDVFWMCKHVNDCQCITNLCDLCPKSNT